MTPMSGSAIQTWLRARQRKALSVAYLYFALALLGGMLALLANLGIAFVLTKILWLLAVPSSNHADLWAWFFTLPFAALLFVDCRRTERDDMSLIPLWFAREYFHIGPRLIFDAWRVIVRARQFALIDVDCCAQLLAYLLSKTTPTTREQLSRAFPQLSWEEIVAQLRSVEGVILFRNTKSVSLLAPLRLELRQLLAQSPAADTPQEEPQANPVDQPHQLSPHEILGVSDRASIAEIKSAYRNRVKECHPDRFSHLDDASRQMAEEWTKALNAAYAALMAQREAR